MFRNFHPGMGRALPGMLKVKKWWRKKDGMLFLRNAGFSNDPTLDQKKDGMRSRSLFSSWLFIWGPFSAQIQRIQRKTIFLYSELKHFTDLKIAEIWPIC